MADELNKQAIENLTTTVHAGFAGVHTRLDKLNGKVGDLEQEAAILESQRLNSRIVQLEASGNKTAGVLGLLKWMVPSGLLLQIIFFIFKELQKGTP